MLQPSDLYAALCILPRVPAPDQGYRHLLQQPCVQKLLQGRLTFGQALDDVGLLDALERIADERVPVAADGERLCTPYDRCPAVAAPAVPVGW